MRMTVQQLRTQLLLKRSYFKESYNTIASRFNVPIKLVVDAFNDDELQAAKKRYNSKAMADFLKQQVESVQELSEPLIKSSSIGQQHRVKPGMHIVLGCMHVPFENKDLVRSIAEFISNYSDKIAGFHLIGDFLDLRSLSFHDRGQIPMYGVTLGHEYRKGNEVLDYFEEVLPSDVQKSFIYGNHEDRYLRLGNLTDVNQYIDALPSPTQALKLKERGYLIKEDWKEDFIQLGKLQLIHGIFCTQTPAKTHLQRIKSSVMFAHTHRLDSYYESDHGAFNIACLADIKSEAFGYLSRVERLNWKNGFGLVHLEKDGSFQADVINCHNNKFFYGGKRY